MASSDIGSTTRQAPRHSISGGSDSGNVGSVALGWIDGQTVKLEFRWIEGRPELLTRFAEEIVMLNPKVVLGGSNDLVAERRVIPTTIPIVTLSNDFLGTGLVKSLSRPSGNITGISLQNLDLANKRFELLREVAPNIHRLAIMANANNAAFPPMREMNTVIAPARKFEIDPIPLEIRRTEDIESASPNLASSSTLRPRQSIFTKISMWRADGSTAQTATAMATTEARPTVCTSRQTHQSRSTGRSPSMTARHMPWSRTCRGRAARRRFRRCRRTRTAQWISIFGPKAPPGKEVNWVPSDPTRRFELMFGSTRRLRRCSRRNGYCRMSKNLRRNRTKRNLSACGRKRTVGRLNGSTARWRLHQNRGRLFL